MSANSLRHVVALAAVLLSASLRLVAAVAKQQRFALVESGLNAPPTEEGYKLVAGLKSEDDMKHFMTRVIEAEGLEVNSTSENRLSGIVPLFKSSKADQSFEAMKHFLFKLDWVKVMKDAKNKVVEVAQKFSRARDHSLGGQVPGTVVTNLQAEKKTGPVVTNLQAENKTGPEERAASRSNQSKRMSEAYERVKREAVAKELPDRRTREKADRRAKEELDKSKEAELQRVREKAHQAKLKIERKARQESLRQLREVRHKAKVERDEMSRKMREDAAHEASLFIEATKEKVQDAAREASLFSEATKEQVQNIKDLKVAEAAQKEELRKIANSERIRAERLASDLSQLEQFEAEQNERLIAIAKRDAARKSKRAVVAKRV